MAEIVLKSCTLRKWQPGDEGSLVLHANNYHVWKNLRDFFPHPYTHQDALDWINFCKDEEPVQNFAIVVNGQAAGGAGIALHTDVDRKTATTGYWLGQAHWGKGIATEVLRAMCHYSFQMFDLARLNADVFHTNIASGKVLEKAGFGREGYRKKACFKDGEFKDLVLYGLLKENFLDSGG